MILCAFNLSEILAKGDTVTPLSFPLDYAFLTLTFLILVRFFHVDRSNFHKHCFS